MPNKENELTGVEERILLAAGDYSPGGRLSAEELAERADISVQQVYEKLQDPQFRNMFLEVLTNSLSAEVPSILNAFVSKGKEGSFKHGKLLLEIAGVYHEKKEIKGKLGVSDNEEPFKDEEQKKAFMQDTLKKLNNKFKADEEE